MNTTIQNTIAAARAAEAALAARIHQAADHLAQVGRAPVEAALARLELEADKAAQRLAEGQEMAEVLLGRFAARFTAFTAAIEAPAPVQVEALPLLGVAVPGESIPPEVMAGQSQPDAMDCADCGRAVPASVGLCEECSTARTTAFEAPADAGQPVQVEGPVGNAEGQPVTNGHNVPEGEPVLSVAGNGDANHVPEPTASNGRPPKGRKGRRQQP